MSFVLLSVTATIAVATAATTTTPIGTVKLTYFSVPGVTSITYTLLRLGDPPDSAADAPLGECMAYLAAPRHEYLQ